jgi:hypothetical protein
VAKPYLILFCIYRLDIQPSSHPDIQQTTGQVSVSCGKYDISYTPGNPCTLSASFASLLTVDYSTCQPLVTVVNGGTIPLNISPHDSSDEQPYCNNIDKRLVCCLSLCELVATQKHSAACAFCPRAPKTTLKMLCGRHTLATTPLAIMLVHALVVNANHTYLSPEATRSHGTRSCYCARMLVSIDGLDR